MRKFFLALGALILAIGFAMLGRDNRRRERAEEREIGYLIDGSEKALKKAQVENEKANVARERAKEAAKVGQAALDKIGAKDAEMADVIADWNTDRVQ